MGKFFLQCRKNMVPQCLNADQLGESYCYASPPFLTLFLFPPFCSLSLSLSLSLRNLHGYLEAGANLTYNGEGGGRGRRLRSMYGRTASSSLNRFSILSTSKSVSNRNLSSFFGPCQHGFLNGPIPASFSFIFVFST